MARLLLWLAVACSVGPALGRVLGAAQQEVQAQQEFYKEYEQGEDPKKKKLNHGEKKHSNEVRNIHEDNSFDNRDDSAGTAGQGGNDGAAGSGNSEGASSHRDSQEAGAGAGGDEAGAGNSSRPGWMKTTLCTSDRGRGGDDGDTTPAVTEPHGAGAANGTDTTDAPLTEKLVGSDAASSAAAPGGTTKPPYVPPSPRPAAHLYIDDD